jgi:hypothetical protein
LSRNAPTGLNSTFGAIKESHLVELVSFPADRPFWRKKRENALVGVISVGTRLIVDSFGSSGTIADIPALFFAQLQR